MKDNTRWVKLSQDFPQHPKTVSVSIPARWLFVEMLCYCSRFLTDGEIPAEAAKAIAMPIVIETTLPKELPEAMRKAMLEAMREAMLDFGTLANDLINELISNDPTKPSLTKTETGFKITDYLEYQTSKSDILARQKHGRKMAQARWGKKNNAKSNAVSNAQSITTSNVKGNAKSNTEIEIEKDISKEKIYKKESEPLPAKTRKRAVPLPADWKPNPTHARIALERGIDLEAQAEKFRDYARAHGKAYRDWDAGFRNWLRSDYTKPENTSTHYVSQGERVERMFKAAANRQATQSQAQTLNDQQESVFGFLTSTGGDAA